MQRCQPNRPKGDAAAEILGVGNEERPLKFGSSFTTPKATSFHTLKYDFKPASVDINKMATVDVEMNQQVTVTVPHLDGSGTEHTIFKGSQRPYQKECVLIIDHQTGEMKLERLSGNIQVKKTRKESMKMGAAGAVPKPGQTGLPSLGDPVERLTLPPLPTIPMRKTHTSTSRVPSGGSRQKLKPPPVASSKSGPIPHHSPLPPSPLYLSPGHHLSPPGASGSSQATAAHQTSPNAAAHAASLPMIGLDDYTMPMDTRPMPMDTRPMPMDTRPMPMDTRPMPMDTRPMPMDTRPMPMDTRPMPMDTRPMPMDTRPKESSPTPTQEVSRPIGSLSDSSSDSSSNSDSSSDSESESEPRNIQPVPYIPNGQRSSPPLCRPDHLLKEDLQLSESGSESD